MNKSNHMPHQADCDSLMFRNDGIQYVYNCHPFPAVYISIQSLGHLHASPHMCDLLSSLAAFATAVKVNSAQCAVLLFFKGSIMTELPLSLLGIPLL